MTDSAKADFGVGRWVTYADAVASRPEDGTGGSPNVTFTRSTSSPLSNLASFVFSKDAVNRRGQGASCSFTIDAADQGKVVTINFDYAVSSGTFVAGSDTTDSDLIVYIYDVTNAALIEPTPFRLFSNSSLASSHSCSFQTASNSTSYRLILHCATTSAVAYDVKFDNFSISREPVVNASIASDWVSYTPTINGFGTVTIADARYRRVGDSLEIQTRFSTGTHTAVLAEFSLPSGLIIDPTKLTATGVVGSGYSQAGIYSYPMLALGGYSSVWFGNSEAGGGQLSTLNGTSFVNSNVISFVARVPISGWASQTQASNQSQNRVIAAYGSFDTLTHTSTGNWQGITALTSIKDTTASLSTGGTYTIPESGWYSITNQTTFSANATGVRGARIKQNGSVITSKYEDSADGTISQSVVAEIEYPFVAGDAITFEAYQSSGGNLAYDNASGAAFVNIHKIQGPVATLPTEKVSASYSRTTSQSISNSGAQIIDFSTKITDTHNAVTTGGSWKFTAPVAGEYIVNAAVFYDAATYAAGNIITLKVYKNGTLFRTPWYRQVETAAAGFYQGNSGRVKVSLLAGEYIDVRTENSRTAGSTNTFADGAFNYIEIELVK